MTDSTSSGARPHAPDRTDKRLVTTQAVTVGVDMGGSKTRFQMRRGNEVLADRTLPSGEVLHAEYEATADALAQRIRELVRGGPLPEAVVVGAHGCDSPAQKQELRLLLTSRLPVACRVVNDAELLLPAAGLASGVAVVAGTGSVAIGHTVDGQVLQCGGWGWMLGDEGGAAGIIRESVRACLDRADRGLPADQLSSRLTSAFGVTAVPDLAAALARGSGASAWGQHAAAVFVAADEGCPAAAQVIEEAGAALAGLALRLASRGVDADVVVIAGGVILAQQRLRDAFTRALFRVLPRSRCMDLRTPPVVGGVVLAQRLVATGQGPAEVTLPSR